MISNVLDGYKEVSVFPDEFKYSGHFQMISNVPISKLSGNFQMISGFQDIPGFFFKAFSAFLKLLGALGYIKTLAMKGF